MRIHLGAPLTVEDVNDISAEKEFGEQLEQEIRKNGYTVSRGAGGKRRCGKCGNIRHTARTCHIDEEMSYVNSSD